MNLQNFTELLDANGSDVDNLRGRSLQSVVFESVSEFEDAISIEGVVFESPILAFELDDSETIENSIVKLFNAIIRNAISTYNQVIDFEETPNFDRILLTELAWTNCTFLNFDKTKLSRQYFFGTFDNSTFDNIDFTTRNLRMTKCEVEDSSLSGDFNETWIDQCVLRDSQLKGCAFKLFRENQDCLFDRMYVFWKDRDVWDTSTKDKHVTPNHKMTELYNCHFDKLLLERKWSQKVDGEYQPSTEIRLRFPYKGIDTCSFTVYLLSQKNRHTSEWWKARLPSQLLRPNTVPKRKKTDPKASVYSSFIDFCDKEDLWYFMGFRREDLLRAKKLTFVIANGFKELFIDASSHTEKEVLNLELMCKYQTDTVIEDCKFKNMDINLRLSYSSSNLKAYLIGSTFEDCVITIENTQVLELMNCTFINCTIRGFAYHVDSYVNETVFKDCSFESATLKLNFHPNIKLEGTVTYDKDSHIVLHPNAPNNIEELGFIKKG